MADRLAGKTAFITAAGQGIGKATALAFSAEGARVHATDINGEALKGLDGVANVQTSVLDVTDGQGVQALAGRIGPVDIIVNCAGFVHHGTILNCTESDWDFSFNINAKGMYLVISSFLPSIVDAGGGSIINVSSIASSIMGLPNRFVYGASKAAVIGLTKAVAADFVSKGVRCNAICPGTVDTPSLEDRISSQGDYDEVRKAFIARQPMGRLGTAEEIASLAVYLGSDESAFTTGGVHMIDGGMSI
ncbi:MAG: SDR family oxidoreductase [Pseudomonadota bacterium]